MKKVVLFKKSLGGETKKFDQRGGQTYHYWRGGQTFFDGRQGEQTFHVGDGSGERTSLWAKQAISPQELEF